MPVRVVSGLVSICAVAVGALLAVGGPAYVTAGIRTLLGHSGFVLIACVFALLVYNLALSGGAFREHPEQSRPPLHRLPFRISPLTFPFGGDCSGSSRWFKGHGDRYRKVQLSCNSGTPQIGNHFLTSGSIGSVSRSASLIWNSRRLSLVSPFRGANG